MGPASRYPQSAQPGVSGPGTPPRAVVFDWDNTLVDTWPAIHAALAGTFQAFGRRPWSYEETRANVRASARDAFPVLFGADAEAAMQDFYQRFEAVHLTELREVEGAGKMLASLRRLELPLAVVSNKRGDILRREAEHLGWTAHFARLVGAMDAERDKPAREPVDLALAAAGVAAGPDVWFVGDTDIDIECAVNAGCRPVLLRLEPLTDGEMSQFDDVHRIGTCLELVHTITNT